MTDKLKAGRPKGSGAKQIDIEELQKWARAGATLPEMAQRLGVSLGTLNRRLAEVGDDGEDGAWRVALEMAQGEAKISLRSKQFAMALAGNVTMLIWLGKQWLGQKDKIEHAGTGPQGEIMLSTHSERLKADLDTLHGKLEGADSSAPEPRPNGTPLPRIK